MDVCSIHPSFCLFFFLVSLSPRLGYGGVLFELSTEAGDLRALFLDLAVDYGYLFTLDDFGPTLKSRDNNSHIGATALGMLEISDLNYAGRDVVYLFGSGPNRERLFRASFISFVDG